MFLLHLAFPSFRVLLLVPLLFVLLFPRVTYVPVETSVEEASTDTTLLLPAQDAAAPSSGLSPLSAELSKYGTFRSGRSIGQNSIATTRTATPAPSTVRVPPPKAQVSQAARFWCIRGVTDACIHIVLFADPQEAKEDIALDPSWREIFDRIKHITPYLWPSKSFPLQFLAVRTTRLCRVIRC